MKIKSTLLILLCLSTFLASAQTQKEFQDKASHFRLFYPDSLTPVVLSANEDIEAQADVFVIEVYQKKQKFSGQNEKSDTGPLILGPDNCYTYKKEYKTKKGLIFKLYTCDEGAAGHLYSSSIFMIEKAHRTYLLKFTNSFCNVCTDDKGDPIVYNEKKATQWMMDILQSVRISR